MTTPRHLWSGDWARESESAAEEMDRRRERFQPGEPPVQEPPKEPEREPRTPLLTRVAAAFVAFMRSLRAATARGFAAAVARLRTISPRQVGLVALATVAGAGVALGAAALAGGGRSGPTTSDAKVSAGRPWLGLQTVSQMGNSGATVLVVDAGGPAQRAGVQPGDVITQVDGQPITSPGILDAAIAGKQPGQQVQLLVNRYGQSLVLYATLGSSHGGP
ncbi:MAG TPA: PDZ domain-containing protein [Solirubrobacteraceae bacterium]|nr:PDZ domain-containing protein [Solirubrobacteraceae bacterium]